jgi:hypothetical protein
VFSSLSLS